MKNLSLVLNAVLLIAVAVLYFLHFSSGKKNAAPVKKSVPVVTSSNGTSVPMIAYVELDSLNERIVAIKSKRTELETEQKAIEAEWENGYRGLENQKNNFLKRGDAITQEEAAKMQESLLRQQEAIDRKKANLAQKLAEKSIKSMEHIQDELKSFLEEYNKDKRFSYILTSGSSFDFMVYKDSTLDITEDVISGMNERMKVGGKP